MKLEKILKVTGAVVLTSAIIYKVAEEYAVRSLERDVDRYMEKVREGL